MITLTPITPANALVYKSVRLRALADTPLAFGSTFAEESLLTDAQWVARVTQWGSGQSAGYLALDGGQPCGLAAGFLDKDDPSRASLVSMWVADTHRRQGVGRLLVSQVLAWARSQRVDTLRLSVTSSNTAAIDFYRRLGFAPTGRTEPYPNDPTLIEHEMSRPLP